MKKKVLGIMMCFCLMAGILSGCGAEGAPASDDAEQTDSNISNESNSGDSSDISSTTEPTIEPTQEPTPEPEINTFAEKINMQFSEPTDISLPCFITALDSSNREITDTHKLASLYQVEDTPALYHIESIEKSEPDADGNVTYTIRYICETTAVITRHINRIDFGSDRFYSIYSLLDYYTGTFLLPEINGSDEMDIAWENTSYHISVSCTKDDSFGEWSSTSEPDKYYDEIMDAYYTEVYHFSSTGTHSFEYQVTVPADYDGLILCIDKDGKTKEDSETWEGNREFGTIADIEDASEYIFIRVSDNVQ